MLPLRWSEPPTRCSDPSLDRLEGGSRHGSPDIGQGACAGTRTCAGTGTCAGSCLDQPPPSPPDGALPEIVVRSSSRRRKTAAAFWDNGRIVVVMPAHVPPSDRPELIEWLVARVLARRPGAKATDDALAARAAALADRYVDGVRPASIRWVTNQGKRWGSCTTHTREIRLSHRLRLVPDWVLDATIVHELAHLLHPDHSAAFHAVADRYPRQRDALLFLEGYSLGLQTGATGGM